MLEHAASIRRTLARTHPRTHLSLHRLPMHRATSAWRRRPRLDQPLVPPMVQADARQAKHKTQGFSVSVACRTLSATPADARSPRSPHPFPSKGASGASGQRLAPKPKPRRAATARVASAGGGAHDGRSRTSHATACECDARKGLSLTLAHPMHQSPSPSRNRSQRQRLPVHHARSSARPHAPPKACLMSRGDP